jgi:oxalyl-CoA decarboxylase
LKKFCLYGVPYTLLNQNTGVFYGGYKGDPGPAPAPTVLNAQARHELIAEAFGGKGYHVATPSELRSALSQALASNGPSIIDCALDPAAGVESGHLGSLNPSSAATPAPAPVSADG